MSILGIVRLAPGEVGYYDDLTRIHLTIATPEKSVVEGTNTKNLKRAVKSGRLQLVSGSLESEASVEPVSVSAAAPISKPVENKNKAGKKIEKAPEESKEADVEVPAVEQTPAASDEPLVIEQIPVETPVATPVVDAYADFTDAEVEVAEKKTEEVKKETKKGRGK